MSDSIADLLELDRPEIAPPAPADEPIAPIELDDAPPAEPAWLAEARAAIRAAPTRAALNEVCAPMRAWPEAHKVLIRPIRDARWAVLSAAERTTKAAGGTPARGVAVMAATAATVAAAAPVVATSAPTPAITAPTEATTVPTSEGRPMVATWRRIIDGPHAGEVSERIRGYSVLLGEPCAAQISELRATVARLDAEIRPLADDVTSRASMLEFS